MAENRDESERERLIVGRRSLVGAAMIGTAAMGAAGLVTVPARAATRPSPDDVDPAAPPGLAKLAMLDQRFAITYQDSVPAAMQVITNYFAALSRRDPKGMAACLHFPFASYEGVDVVVVDNPAAFAERQPASMSVVMDPHRDAVDDGYIKPGSYDVLYGLEVVTTDPVNVCVALTYDRYDKTGYLLLRSQGIYAVTNNDGRWAIQLISTIITPADMLTLTYPDTVETALRLRMNHDLAYEYSDDAFDDYTYQYGTIASVKNDVVEVFFQKVDNMEPYRVKGVKSRLSVRVNPPRTAKDHRPAQHFVEYRKQFPKLGLGKFGFVYGTVPEARVIHAGPAKAHVLSGPIRFTATGEEINRNDQLFVVTLKPGRWGIAGAFSYVCPHDRTNDAANLS